MLKSLVVWFSRFTLENANWKLFIYGRCLSVLYDLPLWKISSSFVILQKVSLCRTLDSWLMGQTMRSRCALIFWYAVWFCLLLSVEAFVWQLEACITRLPTDIRCLSLYFSLSILITIICIIVMEPSSDQISITPPIYPKNPLPFEQSTTLYKQI